MNRFALQTLIFAAMLAAASTAVAQGNTLPAQPSFESFNVIVTNNIFDANRRPGRSYRPGPSYRPQRVEGFTLVGTMSYQNGTYAFFDGSSPDYRKSVKISDTIAGYKVTEITPNAIKLAAASNQPVSMRVGMQMRRENGGPWALKAEAQSFEASSPSLSSSTTSSPGSPAPSLPAGPESDVIRRLMLKRAQESK
jgi:hypothetical protein